MPRVRADVARAEKLSEIIDAAQARLQEGGYDAMSVAGIARDLRISQNTVYWYIKSKDNLLAAVARRLLESQLSTKPSGRGELAKVIWAAATMAELEPLRELLDARAPHCQAVESLRAQLGAWTATLLTSGLRKIDHPDTDLAATAFQAAVEGLIKLKVPAKQRDRVITWAFRQTQTTLRADPEP